MVSLIDDPLKSSYVPCVTYVLTKFKNQVGKHFTHTQTIHNGVYERLAEVGRCETIEVVQASTPNLTMIPLQLLRRNLREGGKLLGRVVTTGALSRSATP